MGNPYGVWNVLAHISQLTEKPYGQLTNDGQPLRGLDCLGPYFPINRKALRAIDKRWATPTGFGLSCPIFPN